MRAETTSAPNLTDLPKADIESILNYQTSSVEKPPADDNSYKWLNYGIQNLRAIRIDEAVNALNKAIKLKPDFYQAYYVLGLVLQGQEKYQEAIAAYEQATKIRPDYYKAWREQSEALANLKKYPEAIAAIDQAINNDPKDFTLYVNKGRILSQSDRFPDAEAAYTEAIKIKENSIAYYNRGVAQYYSVKGCL